MEKRSDAQFLNQLVESLEEAIMVLEYSYKTKKDFDKSKKLVLQIQNEISRILE